MASVDDFQRYVLPFMREVPLVAMNDAIADACFEFCKETRILRSVITVATVSAAEATVEITPPANTEITEVKAVWVDDKRLYPMTQNDLYVKYPQGYEGVTVATPADMYGFFNVLAGTIQLVPACAVQVLNLKAEVVYAPTRDALDIPDMLLRRHGESIGHGAMARLHQHVADYADASRVPTYDGLFKAAIMGSKDDSVKGYSRSRTPSMPNPGAKS